MKFFFRLFQDRRKESSRRRRARGRYRTNCELLECRTLLASVMDSGTTLQIELEGSERLQIVADSSSYTFTSSTSTFSDSGVTDASDFVGFGTGNLTFNDFTQYGQLEILDAAAGTSVEFLDSVGDSFQHDIDITLNDGAASDSVIFNGDSTFGNQSLSATADGSIRLLNGSRLSVVNGNITLSAHNQTDGSEQRRGIDVDGAIISTSGTGNISLTGHGAANAPGVTNLDGIWIAGGSRIESTSDAGGAGTIQINGTGGDGSDWNVGVQVDSAIITSVIGDISLSGRGGDGSGHSNRGVRLTNQYLIESTGSGTSAADISIDADGGEGTNFNIGFEAAAHESSPGIQSHDGHITIDGKGSRLTLEHSNYGTEIGSLIHATGDGRIAINGQGGRGTGFNRGVLVTGTVETTDGRLNISGHGGFGTGDQNEGVVITENAVIASSTASIIINGDAGGNNSHGVEVWGTAESGGRILSAGSGDIVVIATGGAPDGGRVGEKDELHLYPNTLIGGADSTGDIQILADTITLDPASEINGRGNLQVGPYSESNRNRTVTLGGSDRRLRTDLNLTVEEIQTFNHGFSTITLGDWSSFGTVMTIDAVSLDRPTEFQSAIIHNVPESAVSIADVALLGTIAPGRSAGTLSLQAATLKSDSVLQLDFGGSGPGAGRGFHDQLSASGSVDIQSDVELQAIWLPSWKPQGGEQLTIVRRQGGTGIFHNLPEGSALPDFFDATISYQGGDGDDIVLSLPQNVAIPKQTSLAQLGADAITIFGADAIDMAGGSVGSVGDVNGDGFNDFLIGADHGRGAANDLDRAGEAYLIYGSAAPPTTIDLSRLGEYGVKIFAASAGDYTGRHLSGGDFNRDGYSDILISADERAGNNAASAGGAYLIWGGPSLPSTIELGSLGAAGVTIVGLDANDNAGHSVSFLGDVNNDGIDDFAIGAKDGDGPNNEGADQGEVYVVFGSEHFPEQLDLAAASGNLLTIYGADAFDRAGSSIDALGDVNGDGMDDFGIGAPGSYGPDHDTQATGAAFIVYGRETFPATMNLATDADVVFYGTNEFDQVGLPVRGGGDVNGDGFMDILLGANGADSVDEARPWAGETHLIWGGPDLPSVIDTGQLGTDGITIFGAEEDDFSGRSVDIVGDLNADGFADLVIGAHRADGIPSNIIETDTGMVYVILGGTDLPATIDLRDPDAVDFTLIGADLRDEAGISVHSAGDIDNDGLADFLVGASDGESFNNARSDAGEVYVVYGNSLFLPAIPTISEPTAGSRLSSRTATITWAATANAVSYELWLEKIGFENNPITNPVTADTSFTIQGLSMGRYRAWVRANRSQGGPTAWTTTAFTVALQTEIHDDPADGSVSLRPTISWDDVAGATGYRVYISNVTQQQAALVDTVVSATEFTPAADLSFGIHRIWVQPIGSENFAGPWSASRDYFVGPQLLSPLTSTLNHRPTFSWSDLPGVETVQLYVQRGSAVVVNESGLTDTTYTPDFLAEGSYRWWIRGFAANGRGGRWSARGEFNVGGSTTVTGPTEVVDDGLAQITWQPVDGATAYELYLYSDTEKRIVQRMTDLTATTLQSSPLRDGDYRVWIRSYVNGEAIRWSRAHAFTVAASAPSLTAAPVSPVTPTFSTTPEFVWTADSAATAFNLYLTNGSSVLRQTGITATQWTASSPLAMGTWNWWVQSVDALGRFGPWSEQSTTDTSGRAIVLPPTLTSNSATFRWTKVVGANRYILQVNRIENDEQVVREEQIVVTSLTLTAPLPAGGYRIWVRAVSGDRLAPWSLKFDTDIM